MEAPRLTTWPADLGVLLIGHGTRDQQGLAEFAELVLGVRRELAPVPVESAFLELATPPIAVGIEQLVGRGVRRLVVAPVLLFAAGHAKSDIPAAVNAALKQHPGLDWRQADHLGCHPQLLDLSEQRFRAGWGDSDPRTNRCRLLVVGRGSHDAEATREALAYAELLRKRVGLAEVQVSFLAMAQPRFSDSLAAAAEAECDMIVVQPHLLFRGELLEEVQQRVLDWSRRAPAKHWFVTGHLGPASQVISVMIDRCQQARARFS